LYVEADGSREEVQSMGVAKQVVRTKGLEAVRDEFDQWRANRKNRRTRIPERFWKAAVELTKEHGVYRVARALRLDYSALKKRATAVDGGAGGAQADEPMFVELEMSEAGVSGECMVEMENHRGAKMRIALKGTHGVDVQGLCTGFWRG
jgi:hypothetical protein